MTDLCLKTLPQLSNGQDWRIQLAHVRDHDLLIWTTRGQGRAIFGGRRRGTGTHNAIFVPAGHLMALEVGRQGFGQVMLFPAASELRLPQGPHLLRIRDNAAQSELITLIEAMTREQSTKRPLQYEAMEAQAALISVWLRRQLAQDEHIAPAPSASVRLTSAYFEMIVAGYRDGLPMAHYAAELGVTPTHLTRVCRAETGLSAADLLSQCQLHHALTLLSDTDIAIQDIARFLGYGSAAYFARVIKQHTGKSPRGLRNYAAQQQRVSA